MTFVKFASIKPILSSLCKMELRQAMKKRKTRARISLRHRRFCVALRRSSASAMQWSMHFKGGVIFNAV